MVRILSKTVSAKSLFKFFGGLIIVLSFHLDVAAQAGYQYRSKQSGDWGTNATWERSNNGGSSWSSLSAGANPPNQNADQIYIRSGHVVTVAGTASGDQLTVESGATLTVPSTGTLNIWDGTNGIDLVVNGTFKNAGTITKAAGATIEFLANSVYKHDFTTTFGTIPVANWDVTSTVEFNEYTTPAGAKTNFNQAFGNVKWNTLNLTANTNLANALTTINGNLEIASTNGNVLVLSNNTSDYTLNLTGNLLIGSNSILNFGSGTGNTFNVKLNLGGNLNITGSGNLRHGNVDSPAKVTFTGQGKTITLANPAGNGSINGGYINYEVASGANITLNSNLYLGIAGATRDFVVNGILNTGTNIISGQGNFIVSYNSTLGVGSAAGIALSGTTGNIQVSGMRSFGLANYIYNGGTVITGIAQVTGSGLPTNVASLNINNLGSVTLSAPVIINSELRMTKGVFYTSGTNTLTINNSVPVYTSSEFVSYVDGPISHKLETYEELVDLKFPVGKNGNYRPVVLSVYQFDAVPTTFTAEQVDQAYVVSGTLPATVNKVSQVRYFRINRNTTADLTAKLQLAYGSDDGVTEPQNLTIAKYNATNGWIDIMGTSNGDGTITSDLFDNFSDFMLANKTAGNNPLPVELIKFTGNKAENGVQLKWATASEKNSAYYDVERSINGLEFENIAQVEAKGNSTTMQAYQLLDKTAKAGANYYRLKQVDQDGSFTFSKVILVKLEPANNQVVIYPNPTSNTLNIALASNASATVVKVYNILGVEVIRQTLQGSAVSLDVTALTNGNYIVITENEFGQTVNKFAKN